VHENGIRFLHQLRVYQKFKPRSSPLLRSL